MPHIETSEDYNYYHVKNGLVTDEGLAKFEKVLKSQTHIEDFLHANTPEHRWRQDNTISFYKALAQTGEKGPELLATAFHNHEILTNVLGSDYDDVKDDALHLLHGMPQKTQTSIVAVDCNTSSLALHGLVSVAKDILIGSDEEGRIAILSAKGAVSGLSQKHEGHTVLQVLEGLSPARKVQAQTQVLTRGGAACELAAHDEQRLETMIFGLPAASQEAIRTTLGGGAEPAPVVSHHEDPLAHLRGQLKTVHAFGASEPVGGE